jgi:integrase
VRIMARNKKPKRIDYIEWTKQWQSGEKWFARLKAKKGSPDQTLKHYGISLHKFAEYKGSDPDTILGEYKAMAKEDLDEALDAIEVDLDLFINWLCDPGGLKRSSAVQRTNAIRSWLGYNAKSLKGIPTPQAYSESALPLTIDELQEIVRSMDARETFFTTLLKDTGMSRAEAVKTNYGDIRKKLEEGKQFIHLRVVRKKEHVDYDTFIGPNTIEALKTWLNIRRQRGEQIEDDTPLFVSDLKPYPQLSPSGLSQVYERVSERTGIKVRTHKIRKFFETYMALGVRHPIILKHWMGHKVRKGKTDVDARYIIPPVPEQMKLYVESYKYIDLTPQPDQTEVFLAEVRTRMATLPPEQRQRFLKEITTAYRSRAHTIMSDAKIKELLRENPTRANGGSTDCQKIVVEEELEDYLANGWRVQAVLPSGKIVISNET